MIARGLTGRRWFGRVVQAELACPRCQKVHKIGGRSGGGGWEPRLSRWTCQGCGKEWVLGMLLWPARERRKGWKGGKGPSVPIDAVPSPEEALELLRIEGEQAQFRNLEIPGVRATGAQANVAIDGEEEG